MCELKFSHMTGGDKEYRGAGAGGIRSPHEAVYLLGCYDTPHRPRCIRGITKYGRAPSHPETSARPPIMPGR